MLSPSHRPTLDRRLALLFTLAVVGLLAQPSPVLAGPTGGNPNTPAGVEYAIPLERARAGATGSGTPRPPNGSARLFGAGITSGSYAGAKQAAASAQRQRGGGDRTPGAPRAHGRGRPAARAAKPLTALSTGPGSFSPWTAVGGGGLLVVGGLLLALSWRRRAPLPAED
jgi:MYXO-CTERM domain-containing protein